MDERGGRKERQEVWGDLGFGGSGGGGWCDMPKRSASFFSIFWLLFSKKSDKKKKEIKCILRLKTKSEEEEN